ncbi:MAG: polysaccharide biosynthesis protein [Ruminococcaceae bacterium]|nr:polysaccharide biosynthesis protein [Oscillospiraceae bacterium]
MKNNYFSKSRILFLLLDIIIVAFAFLSVKLLCYGGISWITYSNYVDIAIIATVFVISYIAMGIYNNLWLYSGYSDYMKFFVASVAATVISFVCVLLYQKLFVRNPIDYFGMRECILTLFFVNVGLLSYRVAIRVVTVFVMNKHNVRSKGRKRLLIIGAGEASRVLMNDINQNNNLDYNVVGFIDDDPTKTNMRFWGKRVYGTRDKITEVCARENIDEILISIPSAPKEEIRHILEICSTTNLKIRIAPSIDQSITGKYSFTNTREVQIEDLLERDEIVLENDLIAGEIEGKVVLVTGGGGSIGSELCRQISNYNPKKLIIVDIYENNAYDLQNELRSTFPYLEMEVLIASIRDFERLDSIFDEFKPNMVFHAAAHKHVPLMEDSPGEAIKNNVFGTYNVAKCADKHNVDKFVMISTDKAVNPTNVMGATKRVCEMVVQSFQQISKTEFVAVRFGNVLGSNGSVIPLFKRQIEKGGPVTVTHKEVTRFFMTIPEAAQLVLQASVYANGGEIFVLDMGKPVKIYDLAVNLIRLSGYKPNIDIPIVVTGLRPGEKLYEELLMNEEGLGKTSHKKIFIGQPTFMDFEELEKNLKILKDAVETKDNKAIVYALETVVPTYAESKKQKKKLDEKLANEEKELQNA